MKWPKIENEMAQNKKRNGRKQKIKLPKYENGRDKN